MSAKVAEWVLMTPNLPNHDGIAVATALSSGVSVSSVHAKQFHANGAKPAYQQARDIPTASNIVLMSNRDTTPFPEHFFIADYSTIFAAVSP